MSMHTEIKKLVGKHVNAIGNCGTAKDVKVSGVLSWNKTLGFVVTDIKKGTPCTVNDNSIILGNPIVDNFIVAKDVFDRAEEKLFTHFYHLIENNLENSKTKKDIEHVKDQLFTMPESFARGVLYKMVSVQKDKLKIK